MIPIRCSKCDHLGVRATLSMEMTFSVGSKGRGRTLSMVVPRAYCLCDKCGPVESRTSERMSLMVVSKLAGDLR